VRAQQSIAWQWYCAAVTVLKIRVDGCGVVP
jgi:hypothetical protein